MSGALSKRQQARNERALQDLIKSVPGNNVCADCQARNPGMLSPGNHHLEAMLIVLSQDGPVGV